MEEQNHSLTALYRLEQQQYQEQEAQAKDYLDRQSYQQSYLEKQQRQLQAQQEQLLEQSHENDPATSQHPPNKHREENLVKVQQLLKTPQKERVNSGHFGRSFSEKKYLREIERDRKLRLGKIEMHQRTTPQPPHYGYGDGSTPRNEPDYKPYMAASEMRHYRKKSEKQQESSRKNHVNRNINKVQL